MRWLSMLSLIIVIAVTAPLATPPRAAAQIPAPVGCAPVRPGAITAGTTVETLPFDGLNRTYRQYIPASYEPTVPTSLVLSFHGFASNAAQQEGFSAWNPLADEHGFIVVYPQGEGFPARWNGGQLFAEGFAFADDVGFVRALITQVSATLCIDPTRIYATGLSNGGGMSNRLACDAADVIAAIGGVAGAYAPLACTPSRPVPVIAFHGTDDRIVPIDGLGADSFGGGALPPVADWIAGWAERNSCDPTPVDLPPVGAVSGIRYTDCANDAEVEYYIVAGGGHTWPGEGGPQFEFITGRVNRDISASAVMWDFFQRHPLTAEQDA